MHVTTVPQQARIKCRVSGCGNDALDKRCCRKHHDMEIARLRERRQRYVALGLCSYCGAEPLPQLKYCEKHARNNARYKHLTRTRPSRYDPLRTDWIIARLKKYEPYLQRDWLVAEPWIRAHIELWEPQACAQSFEGLELSQLRDLFNVYLDGAVNYLENGVRLGDERNISVAQNPW